jgi:hypothetical protein
MEKGEIKKYILPRLSDANINEILKIKKVSMSYSPSFLTF